MRHLFLFFLLLPLFGCGNNLYEPYQKVEVDGCVIHVNKRKEINNYAARYMYCGPTGLQSPDEQYDEFYMYSKKALIAIEQVSKCKIIPESIHESGPLKTVSVAVNCEG